MRGRQKKEIEYFQKMVFLKLASVCVRVSWYEMWASGEKK